MTKFDRKSFEYFGGYLTYKGEFVARFKHSRRDKAYFLSFLIKNFTVEEYFEMTSGSGVENTPVKVLETKGYVSKTVQKSLIEMGYEPTREGYDLYLDDQVAKYAAK